jgi:hypothetical protein
MVPERKVLYAIEKWKRACWALNKLDMDQDTEKALIAKINDIIEIIDEVTVNHVLLDKTYKALVGEHKHPERLGSKLRAIDDLRTKAEKIDG